MGRVSIWLPTPEYSPLCYRIHIFFSDDFTKLGYYTIECGQGDYGFLCQWDSEGKHINHHQIKIPVWPERERAFHDALEAHILIDLHAKQYGLKTEKE